MTYKTITQPYKMSDDAIIKSFGEFVRHHRLEQNLTQKDLASKAGINRTTLSDLELGRRCQLLTLIQVLRVLNKLHVFDSIEVKQKISPMLLAEMEIKLRKKASGGNKNPSSTKSDW